MEVSSFTRRLVGYADVRDWAWWRLPTVLRCYVGAVTVAGLTMTVFAFSQTTWHIDDLVKFNIEAIDARFCDDLPGYWTRVKQELNNEKEWVRPAEQWDKAPEGKGWVVELRGYTYHRGERFFVIDTLVENIARKGIKDRPKADAGTPLSRFMTRLNDFLFSVSLPTQFATAQLFRVDQQGALLYSNAAHPPFLLHQRASGKTLVLEEPSNLLGAMPNMDFEERRLTMSSGDTLFVYTDGLTDRRTEAGEFYSIDRVAALLEESRDADLSTVYDSIYNDVSSFPATDDFKDDIAFVVTRFH